MRRRRILAGLLLALAAPLAAEAQPSGQVYKIGLINIGAPEAPWRPSVPGPFWDRLRELGWVEGKMIMVERRGASGDGRRIPSLAAELAQLKVNVIVTVTGAEAKRAQEGTRTVPICAAAGDLQAEGLVANLAKPEGNVSGVQVVQPDLAGKRLSLLKEVVPGLKRAGLLIQGRSPTMDKIVRAAEDSSRTLGLALHVVEGAHPTDFDRAFSALAKEHARGVLVANSPALQTHATHLVALAAKTRLVAIYDFRSWAEAGGLMSYGPLESEFHGGLAECVDKILRGAKPADVPVQQPTKFELVINLKTAKALGLTIPPSLLQRADQVIE
jgi:putative tryptophan/tyrosine transport system substrate-binding protein